MIGLNPDLDEFPWEPCTPQQLQALLGETNCAWYVVGGWALDLWHGRQTRDHEDLEFCILRPDFPRFSAMLSQFDLFTAERGTLTKLAARDQSPNTGDQFWVFDPSNQSWVFDMMIEPGNQETWAYKRHTRLKASRAAMIRYSEEGIPYLSPAAVLLFKAKHARPKDCSDFERALPKLNDHDRDWLRQCLARFHPDHPWLQSF